MRLLFLMPYGRMAASSRTRVYQYLPYLNRMGIRYDVLTAFSDSRIREITLPLLHRWGRKVFYYIEGWFRMLRLGWRILNRAHMYDILFIQRVIFPTPIPLLLRCMKTPVVYDFDDAIFTTDITERNFVNRVVRWRNGRKLPAMLKSASHVVVENEYTRAYAERYCPNVTTITGPIDTNRYCPSEKNGSSNGSLTLGWIGSPTTEKYLEAIRRPLEAVGHRFPSVRLLLIGAPKFTVRGLPTEHRGWDMDREVADLQRFDIGLMPLTDDAWTRGKGGYKLLQYMAVGIPAIASPVGINRVLVEDEVNGFQANSEKEWTHQLFRLIEDTDLRRRMGEEGRRRMERDYALSVSADRLIEVLKSTCPDRSASSASSTG